MSPVLEDPIHVYAIGTAGCGKTTFAAAFKRHLQQAGHDALLVNLDPGAEGLPYTPDVDARDWLRLSEVMDEYELGPNGAQVMAADLLALRGGEIKEALDDFRPDYVVFDTPGQSELFVYRDAGRILMETLGRERAVVAFLVDPFLARSASAFVGQTMLAATVNFRFQVPQVHILTKTDLVPEEETERVLGWADDSDALLDGLMAERADMAVQLNTDMARVLHDMGARNRLVAASSKTGDGFDDIVAEINNVALGAEDLETGQQP